jgi:predicted O-methyltransferase YrrM
MINMNLNDKILAALDATRDGWCTVEKAMTLAGAVLALRPKCTVEIGTYSGRSFFPVALAMAHLNHGGKAWGIDPYDARASTENESAANAEWWGKLDHGRIERHFRITLEALEVLPFVEIFKARSDEITPPENIGLLHVDGSHTEQAVRDVQRFAQNVQLGGLVCLDDILWESGAVSRASEILTTMGFEELYRVIGPEEGTPYSNNWAMFQRIDFAQP